VAVGCAAYTRRAEAYASRSEDVVAKLSLVEVGVHVRHRDADRAGDLRRILQPIDERDGTGQSSLFRR
jgi:hypothetical protein